MMDNLIIDVKQCPGYSVAGISIVTSLENVETERIMKLWMESFSPRMSEFSSFPGISFGVSQFLDENKLKYIAALPLKTGEHAPGDMEVLHIPGGLYAVAKSPGLKLDDISKAFYYLFNHWSGLENYEYVISPCYELYPADYTDDWNFEIYMPVKQKSSKKPLN